MPDWPRPPIRPEDLPKIRELLTAEEYAALLKRREVSSVAPAHERAPNAAGRLQYLGRYLEQGKANSYPVRRIIMRTVTTVAVLGVVAVVLACSEPSSPTTSDTPTMLSLAPAQLMKPRTLL